MTTAGEEPRIRVGISSCLLGNAVRYDGGHKRDDFAADLLARFVRFVPVCPEVEVGMGTPRPSIRLVKVGSEVRLLEPREGTDHTAAMRRWSEARLRALEEEELCGFILKKDSPSCGMERVKVWPGRPGVPAARTGTGLFAEALRARWPELPVEEEGRLHDLGLRESFVERVFAYRRLRDLLAGRLATGDLVRFHTAEKYLLLAHDPEGYRALGRMVAGAKALPRTRLRAEYPARFMAALARPATRGKNANVLTHMAGFVKRDLDEGDRRELHAAIADYRRGLLPLVVPITLVRHHVRRLGVAWLAGQTYLEPHPRELMLRNHP